MSFMSLCPQRLWGAAARRRAFLFSLAALSRKEALQRDHGIALTAIAERTWTQFYIRPLGPKEPAERAATEYNNSRRPRWMRRR